MYGIRSNPAKFLVLAFVAFGIVAAASAAAAHDDRGVVYRKYTSDRHGHAYDRRYWKKYDHHGVTVYYWKPAGRWVGHHARPVRAACYPVVGKGRDHFGRRARFGGTMCHDRTGRSYIVPGSRYVIRYF